MCTALITFLVSISGSEMEQMLRVAWHQKSLEALVHALQLEAATSAIYINKSMSSCYSQMDRQNEQNKEMIQEK